MRGLPVIDEIKDAQRFHYYKFFPVGSEIMFVGVPR